ncbi:MAG: GTP-binding protein [Candidatus Lokiarchaeota archaeon]|nr:GTP-binding protein [Candidatus Lokiarchaeota archaeon]
MEAELIEGILYTELDEEVGPHPLVWLGEIPQSSRLHISVKTITVLSGESGLIPDSLVILPFPSLNLKGLIKYVKWEEASRRGGIGLGAITLLFRESDDVIFYKYLNYFETPFEEVAEKISELQKLKAVRENYIDILDDLTATITQSLNELKKTEIAEETTKAFPDQMIKDANLINYKFKIIICGDPSVGKSSLILRFTNNAFRRHYIPTLGVHVSDKIFQVKESYVQLVLWDIAGQQKFQTMRQQFYLGSDGLFLIFDLSKPSSFESVSNWFYDIQNQLKDRPILTGFIIGNKRDLAPGSETISEKGSDLARYLNLGYIETSALTGENVEEAFYAIAETLYNELK